MQVHRTPFRPLGTELKGFGSGGTLAAPCGRSAMIARRGPRFTRQGRSPRDPGHATRGRPDGSSAVYARRTIEGGKYRDRLWRVPMTRGRAEQITSGELDMRPRFSPDGQTLLFSPLAPGSRSRGCFRSRAESRRSSPSSRARSARRSGRPTGRRWRRSPRAARSGSASATRRGRPRVGSSTSTGGSTWSASATSSRASGSSPPAAAGRSGSPIRATRSARRSGRRTASASASSRTSARGRNPRAAPGVGDARHRRPSRQARRAPGRDRSRGVLSARAARVHRPRRPVVQRLRRISGSWVKTDARTATRRGARPDLLLHRALRPPRRAASPRLRSSGSTMRASRAGHRPGVACRTGSGSTAPSSGWWIATMRSACGSPPVAGAMATIASVEGGACDVFAVEDGDLRRLSRNGGRWFAPYRRDPERHAVPHRDGHELDAWLVVRGDAAAVGSCCRSTAARTVPTGRRPGWRWSRSPTPASPSSMATRAARPATGRTFAKAIDGNWGDADDSDCMRLIDWAVARGSPTATTSGCSASRTAAT